MFEKQQIAFEKFKKLKVGALFMQMGTGKTRIALELVKHNDVDFLLYICPFSAKQNIEDEIKKWGINCSYKIIGYETLQSSDKIYLETLKNLDNKNCFIIADESIFIKNEETKRFKRLLDLRNKCKYALILNGTPLTKNEWDLYNQLYFLSPLIINMNRQEFLNNFFTQIKYKKIGHNENMFYKFSQINAETLYKIIEPYIFKTELDFNFEQKEDMIFIEYFGEEYNYEKEKFLNKYIQIQNADGIIQMLVSLNKIASCYEEKLKKVIEYIKDKQIICYCNYLKEVEFLSNNVDCFIITGKTKNRSKIISEFGKSKKPLIMTYGVGSFSLNLQFCNEIVFSSINFDYKLMEQSRYRIKRIGQQRNIKYTYFLTNLGITTLILENLKRKATLKNLIEEKIKNGEIKEWVKNI